MRKYIIMNRYRKGALERREYFLGWSEKEKPIYTNCRDRALQFNRADECALYMNKYKEFKQSIITSL